MTPVWEQVGTKVAGVEDVSTMLKNSGLDWNVTAEPMTIKRTKKEVSKHRMLVRDDTGEQLSPVGHTYVPTQNHEAFQLFQDFVSSGHASLDTIGELRGGQQVWGLAKLNASFEVSKGDQLDAYLLLVCPHIQGKALMAALTPVRLRCMNSIRLALRKAMGRWRMVHRQQFDKAMREQAKRALSLAEEEFMEFKDAAKIMKSKKVSDKQALELFLSLAGDDADTLDDAGRKVKQLFDAYHTAPGADPGTKWGVFNAVTYYADYMASRTDEKRLTNAWLGRTGVMKNRALSLLAA